MSAVNPPEMTAEALEAQRREDASHRPSKNMVDRLNAAIEQERRYANEPYARLLADAREMIEALSRDKEVPIVGWMVGLSPDRHPAMYNLEERDKAFSAASRWNRPITALALHPNAPAFSGEPNSAPETSAIPAQETRRQAFEAWWKTIWVDGNDRSSPAFDEQMKKWSHDAWRAGADYERRREAATRSSENGSERQENER